MTEIGRLEEVDIREVWPDEAEDFTPWVASDEGLSLLGKRIGLRLSGAQTEVDVGPFSADIVCIDTATDDKGTTVVIENQLESTDHDHLGKLLTYWAGLGASIVIWISTEFREEHRAAIERLNDVTDENSQFFGFEIEVLQIGDSARAPRFNVAVKPNYWSIDTRSGPGRHPRKVSPANRTNERYWSLFADFVSRSDTKIKAVKPRAQGFMDFRIRKTGANLSAVRLTQDRQVRVELTLTGKTHRDFYNALKTERDEIQREINSGDLKWDQRDARSSVELVADMDPSDESDWEAQMAWMLEKIELFDKAFRGRVQRIQLPS